MQTRYIHRTFLNIKIPFGLQEMDSFVEYIRKDSIWVSKLLHLRLAICKKQPKLKCPIV
ncbi:Uncharacterised protein [Actinobacillus pleuropneumoniae]|nr:Uncharacterised protein [Actinobacillus pleuropneumoniae]